MGQVQSFGILNRGSGLRPSGFTRQATSARLAVDVIQVWINSSPSNCCISHFKAQLAQLFFIQHLKWIKGILCGYAIRSGRHPEGSQRPGRPAAADFPRDVCLTVSRNHIVFLLYRITIQLARQNHWQNHKFNMSGLITMAPAWPESHLLTEIT